MTPFPSLAGWAAVVAALCTALLGTQGVIPQKWSIILGYVFNMASLLSRGTPLPGLGTKLPKILGVLGLVATGLSAIVADPSFSTVVSPGVAIWISFLATFSTKFVHSLTGTGGTPQNP